MTDEQIYKEIKDFFDIEEFVSKKVHDKYGEQAWQFLCPRLLHTILIIRKKIDKPITINNWKWGGKFSQRGLRSNLGYIFLSMFKKRKMYLSAHVMGRAVDFDVQGMTAEEVRMWLKGIHKDLPYKVRLEHKMNGKNISWVHIDMFWRDSNKKVYLFNV
tara:strand:+ start:1361 stop:1837 length:477 start_codon:yes stop_codon:yes gene_type:complete